jgi:ribosomal protein L15E
MFAQATTEEERTARMEEMRTKNEELRKAAESKVKDILSETQFTRFKQLALQRSGIGALSRDDIAEQLKLTEKQREELKRVSEEQTQKRMQLFTSGQRPSREDSERLDKERDAALMSVLSEDQRKQWDTMKGPPPLVAANSGPDDGQLPERSPLASSSR